jgi:hypothetical protein
MPTVPHTIPDFNFSDPHLREHMERVRGAKAVLEEEMDYILRWHDALALAYRERTGQELVDGATYTDEDACRADELVDLFPGAVS